MTIDCDFILQLQEHLAIETNFYCQSVLKGAILQFIWLLAEKNLIIYELLSYNSSMYSFSAKVIQSFLSSSIEKKLIWKWLGEIIYDYFALFASCPMFLISNFYSYLLYLYSAVWLYILVEWKRRKRVQFRPIKVNI